MGECCDMNNCDVGEGEGVEVGGNSVATAVGITSAEDENNSCAGEDVICAVEKRDIH